MKKMSLSKSKIALQSLMVSMVMTVFLAGSKLISVLVYAVTFAVRTR